METATYMPTRRVNIRLVAFFGVLAILLGFPLYWFLQTLLTHGVVNRGNYLEVDLKAISLFEMDQLKGTDADIPPEYRALDGKRVLLVGEMYTDTGSVPGRRADFQLVYSIQKCCFTGTPKIQHFVKARFTPNAKPTYFPFEQVRLMGTLHVGIERDPDSGQMLSVYRVDVESLQPNT